VPPATSGTALSPSQTAAAVSNATTQLQGLTAPTATPAQQALAFELYFNPLGAAYSVLFSSLVIPLWPILNHVTDVLDQLQTIVTDQDEIALASLLAGGSVQGLEICNRSSSDFRQRSRSCKSSSAQSCRKVRGWR